MNYMELMNHFWLINEEIDFTCTEKALYFALLDLANKFFWEKEELSFSLQYLCLKINCNKKMLLNARSKLAEHGLIEVRKGYKNVRAATIRIVDTQQQKKSVKENKTETLKKAVEGLPERSNVKKETKRETKRTTEGEPETTTAASTYKRQDKEKDKNKTRQSSSSTRFVKRKSNEVRQTSFSMEEEERFGEICKNYNTICRSLHHTYKLTDSRKRAIQNLSAHFRTIDDWKAYFYKAEATPFINGGSNGWKADFDWMLQERNFIKIMEGRFYEKIHIRRAETIPEELLISDDNELSLSLIRQGR